MDRYDFKKYLLAELPDSRQDELIFWKKKIPMPVDIVYRMYDERGALFGQYIDHLLACYLFARHAKAKITNWREAFELQPTSDNLQNESELRSIYKRNITDAGLHEIANGMTDLLMIPEYEFTEAGFISAITHKGKKYNRLYLHNEFRKLYNKKFPELLELIATSNGDMYSNVVADILQVYRMGFADAFSVMFNKLLDYTVEKSLAGSKDYSRESRIKVLMEPLDSYQAKAMYGSPRDGSLWEPVYENSQTSVVINTSHPFYSKVKDRGADVQSILSELLLVQASIENESLKTAERKVLGNLSSRGVKKTQDQNRGPELSLTVMHGARSQRPVLWRVCKLHTYLQEMDLIFYRS